MPLVEQILSAAAARSAGDVTMRDGRAVVDRAVWFCACEIEEDADAPTWLIYDTSDGGFGWCRVPHHANESDLVDAQVIFGDHVHPNQVLDWLQGADTAQFDLGSADQANLQDLGRRIRELQTD
ncbi:MULTISPECIES: hypothetical protein [Nocardioides]|uniref:DUF2750 domain-containing protein n=1 Tax=Nocardioides vastitatis TaxID=2568655 RepID=A0ABW0ZIY2_9ACTN|nr:hypothetical protein [Nocardioides sp.]THI90843.1 hypothetical protein E7Z54_22640 [Nocardioides sp.]